MQMRIAQFKKRGREREKKNSERKKGMRVDTANQWNVGEDRSRWEDGGKEKSQQMDDGRQGNMKPLEKITTVQIDKEKLKTGNKLEEFLNRVTLCIASQINAVRNRSG